MRRRLQDVSNNIVGMQGRFGLIAAIARYFPTQIRRFTAVLLIATQTLAVQAQISDLKPKMLQIKRGQVLEFSLEMPLNSGSAQIGDHVYFKLLRPLIVEGSIVLPVNWTAQGRIRQVTRAGKNCRAGKIVWKHQPITAADGRRIRVQPIPLYLARSGGTMADWVPLSPPIKRVVKVGKYVLLAPAVIPLSPFIILMAIGMWGEGECGGALGVEESIPSGTVYYAAVSKGTLVTVR